ncbi:hypothetical protein WCLP8_1100015 [uncultured Gammaproteobacteria bacterium]
MSMGRQQTATTSGRVPAGAEPLHYALDVVEAMGNAGLVAVPVKPTTDMLTAGARAGCVSIETVWKIYRAMVAAAG